MPLMATTIAPDSVDLEAPFYKTECATAITRSQVAAMMGISHQCLSEQLRGRGHLSLLRLLSIAQHPEGRVFLRAFWPHVAESCGFPEVAQALKAAEAFGQLIDVVQCRMAKASLPESRDERRRA